MVLKWEWYYPLKDIWQRLEVLYFGRPNGGRWKGCWYSWWRTRTLLNILQGTESSPAWKNSQLTVSVLLRWESPELMNRCPSSQKSSYLREAKSEIWEEFSWAQYITNVLNNTFKLKGKEIMTSWQQYCSE